MKNCEVKQYKKSTNNDNLVQFGFMRVKINGATDANPLTSVNVVTTLEFPNADRNIYIIGNAVFADNNEKVHASPLDNNTPAGTYALEMGKYTTASLRAGSIQKDFIEFDINNLAYNDIITRLELASANVYGDLSSIKSRKLAVLTLPFSNITGKITDILNAFDNSENIGAGKTTQSDLNLYGTKVTGNLKTLLDHIATIASNGNKLRYNIVNSTISAEGLSPSGTGVSHIVTFNGEGGYSID